MTQTIEQLTDRVRELEALLKEAYSDADEVLRPRVRGLEEEIRRLEKLVISAQNAAIENGAALKSTQDQLVKAEQRVAEACALQVATETRFHWLDAARVAKEIRSGEWHKFVKEV